MKLSPATASLAGVAVFLLTRSGLAQDWPQWRGPNRDGVVHGVKAPEKWPKTLKEQWKVEVGEGVASPVVVGDNVYVFTREKKDKYRKADAETGTEIVVCLDLASGKERWRSQPYPVSYPAVNDRDFPWPRSTPAVANGRVFTLGITGILSCLDVKTGKLLWRKDCKPYPPYGGNSPLVTDGLCIVHYGDHTKEKADGGVTAFDAATGEVKWCCADGGFGNSSPSSGSPILVDLGGERQVVLFTSRELLGISAASGKKLWALREPFGGYTLSNTPILYKDTLIFAGYRESPRAIQLEKGDQGMTPRKFGGRKASPWSSARRYSRVTSCSASRPVSADVCSASTPRPERPSGRATAIWVPTRQS